MMTERTCPRCNGERGTDRTHYEIVEEPDGPPRSVERHTWEPCSYCGGTGTVVE